MNLFQKIKTYLTKNTSIKQTVVKNTFWLMISELLNKGLMFVITIIIARKLGPEQFGIMSFIISFVSIFVMFSDFGLTTLMVREVSKDKNSLSNYLINLSFLKIILGIITFLLIWGFSYFIGKPNFYISLILIYSGYGIITNMGEFIRAFFRPSKSMEHEGFLKIVNGILISLIVGYVVLMNGTLQSILSGYLLAGVLSLLTSIIYVAKKINVFPIKLKKEILIKSIRSGFLLGLGSMFISLYISIDQVIMGFYNLTYDLGIYSFAYKFTIIYAIVWSMIFQSIFPHISESTTIQKYKSGIKRIAKYNLILFLFIELLIFLAYRFQFLDFFGLINYNQSLLILMILLIYCYIEPFGHRGYINLISMGKEKITTLLLLITAIFNIIGNIILIPVISYYGAIITTIGSYLIFFLLTKFMLEGGKHLGTKDPLYQTEI